MRAIEFLADGKIKSKAPARKFDRVPDAVMYKSPRMKGTGTMITIGDDLPTLGRHFVPFWKTENGYETDVERYGDYNDMFKQYYKKGDYQIEENKDYYVNEITAVTNIDKGEEIYIPASDHKKATYETKIKGYEIYRAKSKLGPMPLEHFLVKDPESDGFLGELKLTAFYKYYTSDVFFDPRIQGKGLALPLYAYVVKKGYTLVSDREQSKGSQAIWKNLTKVPGIFVYAWNRKYDEFFQWDPDEDLDSEIYHDEEKIKQLDQDYKDGKIGDEDYKKAKDELEQVKRLSDVRLVAIDEKKNTKESIEENFADGKKKGKSRPGRVKRAGASCKGSVTDLRAKAKKYSGEKGKMYHWCANMKSGKKKAK